MKVREGVHGGGSGNRSIVIFCFFNTEIPSKAVHTTRPNKGQHMFTMVQGNAKVREKGCGGCGYRSIVIFCFFNTRKLTPHVTTQPRNQVAMHASHVDRQPHIVTQPHSQIATYVVIYSRVAIQPRVKKCVFKWPRILKLLHLPHANITLNISTNFVLQLAIEANCK